MLELIQARLPELSPTMRSIGSYCVRKHARLHTLTNDEVSDTCGTVPSSDVRFARLFGHKGLHDFKLAFLGRLELSSIAGVGVVYSPQSKLLSNLEEDVHQFSELKYLVQSDVFNEALVWIGECTSFSLIFTGELDWLAAMNLGDVLQRLGKNVLLADSSRRGYQLSCGKHVRINLDLERPFVNTDQPFTTDQRVEISGRQVNLIGTKRLRDAVISRHQLTLPVFGNTLARRLRKALSIAEAIEAALH